MTKELDTSTVPFETDFQAFLPDQLGEPAWLAALRAGGWATWQLEGYPARNDEEWRFTPISVITEGNYCRPTSFNTKVYEESLARLELPDALLPAISFVNGDLVPDAGNTMQFVHSLKSYNNDASNPVRPGGLVNHSTGSFAALNNAFLEDGAAIVIPDGVTTSDPIVVLYANGGSNAAYANLRSLISVGRNSSATVIEIFTGSANEKYFANVVTEVYVDEGGQFTHIRLNLEGDSSAHIGNTTVSLQRDSVLSSHNITFGGLLSRHDIVCRLLGTGVSCTVNGIYLGHGEQLMDNHTTIDHAAPHCESHELYKGILGDKARGVFNGKIFVRLDAQKTDAKQTNKVLLLSNDARINTKPQLEILADDVKCTHGATVGQLSSEALFYLRSRGIGMKEARAMLVQAFAGDVLARIPVESVKQYLEELLPEMLPHSPKDGKLLA